MAGRNETRDSYTAAGKQMLKAMAKMAKRPHVKVGFPAKTGDKPHRKGPVKVSGKRLVRDLLRTMGAELAPEPDPLTLAQLAILHEFGSEDGKIPERGPIRATHDKNQREWWEATKKLKLKLITYQVSVHQALGLLGEMIKRDIQAAYRKGGDPYVPNAPSTIAAKGSSTPLINTAQLLNGVSYERVDAD
jgi:ribosomal protein S18